MKMKNIVGIGMLLFSIAFFNGCSSGDNEISPKHTTPQLSQEQLAAIHSKADRIAADEVQRIKKSGGAARNPDGYDFIDLNVTGVSPTGPTSANYSYSSGVRNPALLNAGQVPSYNYLFCAAPSHFRYAVVYFYNGYTHTASSINAITGPTGGCIVGSTNFTASMGGTNTSQSFVIVFDVYNGPGGGATQVAGPIWSNGRDLTYPNYHVLNPGNYWY